MRISLLLCLLAGACSLNVDYKGTNYQCNPDGTCPSNYECIDMVCVPSDPVPPACSEDVSAGGFHSCAVRTDGKVWCWGRNDFGQLGNGTAVDSDIPVEVMGLTNKAVAVAAGALSTCALDEMGQVFCWGRNDAGQLGDATTSDSRSPVQVRDLAGVKQLAVGSAHACVLKTDGSVQCWGSGDDGELGDGSTTSRGTAAAVDVGGAATFIATGDGTSCAVLGDGSAKCWGENNDGELGVGDTALHPRPTPVVDIKDIKQIAGGNNFSCALTTAGFAYCWGVNDIGQLGDGSGMGSLRPVAVSLPVGALDIEAGDNHACINDETGTLWCWGSGGDGRLTDGGDENRGRPVRGLLKDTVKFSGGGEHTCALDKAGAIRCSGFNRRGQLGDARPITRGGPVQVNGITNATTITVGARHSCAGLADGRVVCWGENNNGEAGNGSYQSPQLTPNVVYGISSPTQLASGGDHTCALLEGGTTYCWGANNNGQLGDGSNTDSAQPRATLGLGVATRLSLGDRSSCAITAAGPRCWGSMFGNVPQGAISGIKDIAIGGNHVCSVQNDNTVMCYGDGDQYQLGNNQQGFQGAPGVAAIGVTNAARVFARGGESCAQAADGSAKCWGLNEGARLGTGNTGYYVQMPTPVMGVSGIMKLAMGFDASCALKSDGTVWCWGVNYFGQVGDGSYQSRPSAVQISGLSGVKDIASGGSHSCAVNGDGTVVCWGLAASGQLGNGIHEILKPVGVQMSCP